MHWNKAKPSDLKGKGRECVELAQQWDQLLLNDDFLYRQFEDITGNQHLQVVVPKVSRSDILHQLHNGALGGHLGDAKMLSQLRERFYWLEHVNDVQIWCKNCPDCAARKSLTQKRKAPLQGIVTGYPLEMVAVDIIGPFPRGEIDNAYVLVVSDYFTRWVEAYAIPNQEAATFTVKLVEEFFDWFSIPEKLHLDQGRLFESSIIQGICKLLHIQ